MATSLNASLNVTLNPQSLNQASRQVSNALGRITGQASEFQKSLDASTARVFAFGATTAVLNGVTQSFKKLVSTTIEVEKRLIEINSIFQATEGTFNRFRNSIFQVAKETGQAFNTVAEGAAELARQGLSAEETAKRLKAALVLTRISGLDAEKSVKALTAAINGFTSAGLNANQIVNKMVAVDTAYAVSAQDLAEAFSRAGSTAEDAGVSFDQLLGLVTAVEQKTARGGAVIGNAFKSIFTRLSRGSTIEQLKTLGVQIDATQTGIQKLNALSAAIENIADPTVVSKIKELAGGVFQINVVSAALKDLSSETSIFAGAAETAANATNEAFEKNRALGESLSHNINALVVGMTSLAQKVGELTFGPLLENLIGIASKFTEFLDKALDPEKGNVFIKGFFKAIGSFLSGPALVLFTTAFVKIAQLIARFAAEGMKSLLTMGTQAERIKQIEGGIVGLLQRDQNLRNAINASTTSQAQKEQLVLNAIKQENAVLQQQATLMARIAASAAARGVRGVGPQGNFRFNAGFRAEEAEAQMLGAPNSVKARMSEGTIGGRKFIMNNKETEIRNFAGGRDSAVIPHYSRGFVPNYVGRARRRAAPVGLGAGQTRLTSDQAQKIRQRKKAGTATADELALLDDFEMTKSGAQLKPINVNPSPYAFLVPSLGAGAAASTFTSGTTPEVKGTKYKYKLTSGVKAFSPKMKGENIDMAAEPYDSKLEGKIQKSVQEAALQYAKLLVVPKGKNKADVGDIGRRLQKGGQRGAHGAIRGAVGAAFEAAVFSALGLDEFKSAGKRADWDVRNLNTVGNGEVRQIFGTPDKMRFGDMKVGATADTVASFVGKILRQNRNYEDDMLAYKQAKAVQKAGGIRMAAGNVPKIKSERIKKGMKMPRNAARGYVPNYSEGVPLSMMRVHKDSDGSPVAVTNLRDEPNGLQDAIKREREGVGMFASGFVPNYLLPQGVRSVHELGGGNAALDSSAKKTSRSLKKLDKTSQQTDKSMAGMERASMALWMGFGVFQTAMGSMIAAADEELANRRRVEEERVNEITSSKMKFSEQLKAIDAEKAKTQAIEEGQEGMRRFVDACNDAVTALMAFQALNMLTGGGIGRGLGRVATRGGGGMLRGGAISRRMGTQRLGRAGTSGAGTQAQRTRRLDRIRAARSEGLRGAALRRQTTAGGGRGGMGRAIGKAGLLAVGVGGFQAIQTIRDKEASRNEKKERLLGIGGSVAGGLAGAKAGAMVGGVVGSWIPIVGTAVGAFAGAIIGGLAGAWVGGHVAKLAKAEEKDAAIALKASKHGMTRAGYVDTTINEGTQFQRVIKGEDEFAKAVDAGLEKIATDPETGEITAEGAEKAKKVMEKYQKTQQDLIDVEQGRKKAIEKMAAGEVALKVKDKDGEERDETEEEIALRVAKREQEKATLAITGRMFLDMKLEDQYRATKKKQNEAMAALTAELNAAIDEDMMSPVEKLVSRSQKEMGTAQMMKGLMPSIKDAPYAGAVGLATDQHAMFTEMNALAANLEHAKVMEKGAEKGILEGDPAEMAKAVAEAGDKFKEKAEKAGISLFNKVKQIEALQMENAKAMAELTSSEISAAMDHVAAIIGGGGFDVEMMTDQAQDMADEIAKGDKLDPTFLAELMADWDAQGTNIKVEDAIKAAMPELDVNEIRDAMVKATQSIFTEGAEGGAERRMAMAAFDASGVDQSDQRQELEEEAGDLAKQLSIAKANWAKFADAPSTKGIADDIVQLHNSMQAAATSMGGLVEFTTALNSTTDNTANLISNVESLVDEAIIKVEGLRGRVADLEREHGAYQTQAEATSENQWKTGK